MHPIIIIIIIICRRISGVLIGPCAMDAAVNTTDVPMIQTLHAAVTMATTDAITRRRRTVSTTVDYCITAMMPFGAAVDTQRSFLMHRYHAGTTSNQRFSVDNGRNWRLVNFPEISGNISKSLDVIEPINFIRIRLYSWELR